MDDNERIPLEKRVRMLALDILHKVARLIFAEEKSQVEALESAMKEKAERLALLTGEDAVDLIDAISQLCAAHQEIIDEGLTEELQVMMLVRAVRQSEEFEIMVTGLEDAAQSVKEMERKTDEDGGGDQHDDGQHDSEVEDGVLDDLDTVWTN